MTRISIYMCGCKHGKVNSSWSLPSAEWKWYETIHYLLKFFEEKNYRNTKNILMYKAKKFMMTKKFQEKST